MGPQDGVLRAGQLRLGSRLARPRARQALPLRGPALRGRARRARPGRRQLHPLPRPLPPPQPAQHRAAGRHPALPVPGRALRLLPQRFVHPRGRVPRSFRGPAGGKGRLGGRLQDVRGVPGPGPQRPAGAGPDPQPAQRQRQPGLPRGRRRAGPVQLLPDQPVPPLPGGWRGGGRHRAALAGRLALPADLPDGDGPARDLRRRSPGPPRASSMRTAATPTRTMPQVPIRLVSVEVLALDLPMITSFKTAHGTTTRKRTIIVRAEDADGVVGWGESPASDLPLYSPDTYESVW